MMKFMKILIVDDSQVNVAFLSLIISKHPFTAEVEVAENGWEALKKTGSNEYQLVFMDINMPVMDGFEASRRILLKQPNLPIVVLTADVTPEVERKSRSLGIKAVLNKPYLKMKLSNH